MNTKVTKQSSPILSTILSDGFKRQVELALPKHITPDRFLRIILTEFRRVPKLGQCNQQSVLAALVQCAQLGLEPGDALGRAYLIPFKQECQLIIGYRGLIELARRSGHIISIQAHCVHENDLFDFEYGLEEKLRHIPDRGERGPLVGVYGIAKFKDGGHQIEVMFKPEVDKIKKTSKAAGSSYSPWNTHYEEMARKTVIRRLVKYLPSSPELQQAVIIDEHADIGKQADLFNNSLIDNDTGEIIEEPKKEEKQSANLKDKIAEPQKEDSTKPKSEDIKW